ncbi:hypothetical protein HAZT_HAZT001866, partial [Hyalella azteca]
MGLVPVLPFLMVVGQQLGVPLSVQGAVTGITLLMVVFIKPLIAAAADSFPSFRKFIFILLLVFMTIFYSSIYFIKPFKAPDEKSYDVSFVSVFRLPEEFPRDLQLHTNDIYEDKEVSLAERMPKPENFYLDINVGVEEAEVPHPSNEVSAGNAVNDIYVALNACVSCTLVHHKIWACSVETSSPRDAATMRRIQECAKRADVSYSIWSQPDFYAFCFLILGATVMFSTANSVSDAICIDCVDLVNFLFGWLGVHGDYGSQRAWGSVGWATFGLVSGALVDWWSADSVVKSYSPAFLLALLIGLADIAVSSCTLKLSVNFFLSLLCLGLLGYFGHAWLTLPVELLNGPCYGFGYTAIVMYAGRIAPPGTSATVQSVTNICYEALGYSIASVLGGIIIQRLGGATNYIIFGVAALAVCGLHWLTFTKFIVNNVNTDGK